MALYVTPEEHAANPPETWQVDKVAERTWVLRDRDGATLDTFGTRHEAEAACEGGFYVALWHREARWFAGEPVGGWKASA